MICPSSIWKHHCKHGLLSLLFSSRTLTDAMLTVVYIWPLLPTDIHQSMSVWHRPRRPALVSNWTLRLTTHNGSSSSAWAAAGFIDLSTLPNRKEKKFVNNPQQLEGFRLYLLVFDVAAQSVCEQNFSPCFIPHRILNFDLFRTIYLYISYTSKDSKSYKTIGKITIINIGKDDCKISA